MFDYGRLAHALYPAVMAAGREIMAIYGAGIEVETKADGSPVTAADRRAEQIILAALEALAPGVPVVAEEEASAGRLADVGDHFFLVDPLDGTREFAARRPEFTINIALIAARRPIFGLIFAPALGQLYWTEGENASFEATIPREGAIDLSRLEAKRLRTREFVPSRLTVVASRSHGSDALEAWLAKFEVTARTNIGSSLKFCLIANGSADLYPRFGPTMEWDTAAGHAIVQGAGGIMTNLDGSPFLYGKSEAGYLNPGFIVWSRRELIEWHATGGLGRAT